MQAIFLAWALMVQVQLQMCDKGKCDPHPGAVAPKTRVVQRFPNEAGCLTAQLQLDDEWYKRMQTRPRVHGERKHVEAKTTFSCVRDERATAQEGRD